MSRTTLSDDLSWALRLARSGNDRAAIVGALKRRHPKYGHHSAFYAQQLEERGRVAANLYAERTADKALEIVRRDSAVMDPHAARVRLLEFHELVDCPPWPMELAGARRALEAAYVVGFERGRVANLKLDMRTHAMRAGQSMKSVRSHRDQLHNLGWLTRNPFDTGRRLSRLTFHVPKREGHIERPWGSDAMCPPVLLAHDAWRPKGLGDPGWYAWWLENRAAVPTIVDMSPIGHMATLAQLDLEALHSETYNTGYQQGMRFLEERKARAVMLCAPSEVDGAA